MAGDLIVNTHARPDHTLVVVDGELDVATGPTLRHHLDELVAARRPVIVDLDRVTFIDANGLGVLVGVTRRAQAMNVPLRLVCATPRVRRLLRITGLDRRLPLARTRREAAATLVPVDGHGRRTGGPPAPDDR